MRAAPIASHTPPTAASSAASRRSFAPDLSAVAGPGPGVSVFDTATGAETCTVPAEVGRPRSLAYSPDGASLAAGCVDGSLVVYSADGREALTVRAAPCAVNAVAFAPGGRALAAADVDGSVSVWDLPGGRPIVRFPRSDRPTDCLEFAPDGKTLVATSIGLPCPLLYDPEAGRARAVAPGLRNLYGAVAFAPDGRTLAMAGGDGSILLWDLPARRSRAVLTGHRGLVWALAFSPDGRRLASGGDDRTGRLWVTSFRRERGDERQSVGIA
jgi:WD40 repeat protein